MPTDAEEFRFDQESHRYELDNNIILSVTQILQAIGLVNTKWFTDDCRQRGRAVHKAVELDNKGTLDMVSIAPEILPYLDAWRRFKRETQFVFGGGEIPMWASYSCGHAYGVTPDVWGTALGTEQPVLVEIKTGDVPSWAALQTAAQAHALVERGYLKDFPARYGLELKSDGYFRLRQFPDNADYYEWETIMTQHLVYLVMKKSIERYAK